MRVLRWEGMRPEQHTAAVAAQVRALLAGARLPAGAAREAEWSRVPQAEARGVQGWLTSGADETPTLILTGSVGIGKTCLAALAARWLCERLVPVRWAHAAELFELLHGGDAVEREAVFKAPVLVVDDLGAEVTPGQYARPRFEALVNERLEWGRPTVYTTNVGSLAFFRERYGAPVYSRLLSKQTTALVRFVGSEDRRTEEELWRD